MGTSERFEGMTAIVTGGASGIGLTVARRFVAEGGRVALWDIDPARLKAATAELGEKTVAERVDVVDPADVERAAHASNAAMGQIDALVCSAGVAGLNANVVDYPIAEWKRVFDINVNGLFYCNRFVAAADEGARLWPHRQHRFDRRQGGQSDCFGLQRLESGGDRPHQIARQGTRQGRGHRQRRHAGDDRNADPEQVTPEFIAYMRSKIPMERFGTLEEAASLICWLASRECSFSTGAVFDLSGGRATY